MDNKKITFHTSIKKTATQQPIETTWCVFASDYNSVQVEFVVADLRPDEIRTVNPTIVLFMEDGSTVQRTKEQIIQKNNVFSYKLKDREGQHTGVVKAQLKLATVTGETYQSNIYTFTILESLDSVPVPKEFVIDDIQNILQELKHHITHIFKDEETRKQVFADTIKNLTLNEKQRETWFNQSQQTRASLFQVFKDEAQDVLKDAQQVKDLFDELTETGVIEANIREKLDELEVSYAPRLSTLEQNDVSLSQQLAQIANTGTTVEVLEQVTKSEIDRQIQDGTIANLTIEDDSITSTKYKRKSITPDKLADMPMPEMFEGVKEINLYDADAQTPENILANKYINGETGPFDGNAGWLGKKQFLIPGNTYTMTRENSLYAGGFAVAYDKNDNRIRNLVDTGTEPYITFTMPIGAMYIRPAFRNIGSSLSRTDFMIVPGTTLPSEFIPYGAEIDWLKVKVKPSDLTEIAPEKIQGARNIQLFDPTSQTIEGGIIDNVWAINETLTPNSNYFLSKKNYLTPGEQYTIDKAMTINTPYYGIAYTEKDEIFEWIRSADRSSKYMNYKMPRRAAYVRLSVPKDRDLYTIMIVPGTIRPTKYIPYGITLDWVKTTDKAMVDVSLPSSIYAVVGKEVNIYFDNVVYARDNLNNYTIEVKCTVGKQQNERWTAIPTASGTFPLIIKVFEDGHKLVASVTSQLVVSAVSAGGSKNEKDIFIGDSITDGGEYTGELINLFNNDSMDLTLVGTRGVAPNLHEGRSGWTTEYYVNKASNAGWVNPFYKDGHFDFAHYMTSTGQNSVDKVFINLGINDIIGSTEMRDFEDLYNSIVMTSIVDNLELMVDSIHAYDSNIKIGVSLITPPALTQDGFGQSYPNRYTRNKYKKNNYFFNKKLIEVFDHRQSDNIYVVPTNANIDTYHGFTSLTEPANSRTTATVVRQGDPIHPNLSGKKQIADAYYYFIKAVN